MRSNLATRAIALVVLLVSASVAAKPVRVRRNAWKACTQTPPDGVDWCDFRYQVDPRDPDDLLTTTLQDGRATRVQSHVFRRDTSTYFRLDDVIQLDVDGDTVPEPLVVIEEHADSRDWADSNASIYVYDTSEATPRQPGSIVLVRAPIRSIAARNGVVTVRTPEGTFRWRLITADFSHFEPLR